jgi:hypothetical protein
MKGSNNKRARKKNQTEKYSLSDWLHSGPYLERGR